MSFVFFLSYWSWNTLQVFHKCSVTKILWNQLLLLFETDLDFFDLKPQTALLGFINKLDNNLNILQTHILLIFKLNVYQLRERKVLYLNSLIKMLSKLKKQKGEYTFPKFDDVMLLLEQERRWYWQKKKRC